ncbi:MAG: hypothetical protein QW757_03395 [Candidatus Woesearchaeota archaeon]
MANEDNKEQEKVQKSYSNEKTEKQQKKEQEKKEKIKDHLNKKIQVPFYIILGMIVLILLVSLFAIRIPYKAKEKYFEIENYVVEVQDVIEDKENPKTERICVEKDGKTKISELLVYGKKYGFGYKCYAEFKVSNENNVDGDFIYKFIFEINGKTIETEEKKEFIPKFSLMKYYFETNCLEGDKPTGNPLLISAPKTIECNYEKIYPNITITRNETKQREVLKERIVEKTESLFEFLIGKNKNSKVN